MIEDSKAKWNWQNAPELNSYPILVVDNKNQETASIIVNNFNELTQIYERISNLPDDSR